MRGLAILGSTGSVGASALSVVADFPEHFKVVALAAGGNVERLAEQMERFEPAVVSVRDEATLERLRARLSQRGLTPEPELLWGEAGAEAVAGHPEADVVLTAMVGAVGLRPTLRAIRRGVTVAVANKEPLVIAGSLCMEAARRHGASVLPVDSEHSAIHQSLRGHRQQDVRRLLLTGSGGPFRTTPDLSQVTLEQALTHPTWSMGPKITIDSATLMNKGLEVIEARWLFDIPAARIEILIHPESIIHSMVEYVDGSVVAQMGLPDMRIPIAYALGYPARLELDLPPLDLAQQGKMTFEAPDPARFPCLDLAYTALAQGGTYPSVLNAANEVAVAAFLERRIGYARIPALIEEVLQRHQPSDPKDDDADPLEPLLLADAWARRVAKSILE
jgi:1-deoxy-D-xylulose-5-phosphate reductoisomerase